MAKISFFFAFGLQILIILTAAFLLTYPQVGINCQGITCAKLTNIPYILGILIMVYGILGIASLIFSEFEIKLKKQKKEGEDESVVG